MAYNWQLTPQEKRTKRFNRAYQRFMLGSGIKGEYRLLTLTTPETFKGDIHQAWRKFIWRMRRRGLIREYYVVKEFNKKHTCTHLHAVLRLDYLGYQVARQQWNAVTGAVWIHVDQVTTQKGMASYLGKYINKSCDNAYGKRHYWYAFDWIYRKWASFNKHMFARGLPVSNMENHSLHWIDDPISLVQYMNHRLVDATEHALHLGIPITKLIQYPLPV